MLHRYFIDQISWVALSVSGVGAVVSLPSVAAAQGPAASVSPPAPAAPVGRTATASVRVVGPSAGPCSTAQERGKERRQVGKLREARELLASCTKSACGELISQQCRFAVQQLDSDMPSVVPVVTDAAGTPIVEVEVRIDGQLLTSRLDGVSLEVDPGLHEFSFQTSQGVVHTQRLMIVTGQRNRLVPVQLGSAQARPMPPTAAAVAAAPLGAGTATPETPNAASEEAPLTMQASTSQSTPIDGAGPKHSVIPYVLGGVGVAAVGTSLLLANWGSKDNELLDRCAPNCEPSSVDHVKALYLAADISLGVGIVAIAGATWVFVSELNEGRPVAPQATAAYHLDVRPVASGAVAQLGGTF